MHYTHTHTHAHTLRKQSAAMCFIRVFFVPGRDGVHVAHIERGYRHDRDESETFQKYINRKCFYTLFILSEICPKNSNSNVWSIICVCGNLFWNHSSNFCAFAMQLGYYFINFLITKKQIVYCDASFLIIYFVIVFCILLSISKKWYINIKF